jgi:hypothetical protein
MDHSGDTRQTELSSFAQQSLLSALKEVQDTIRAYDTKAQVVGVGLVIACSMFDKGCCVPPQQLLSKL